MDKLDLEEAEKIELRSDEVNDIMSRTPSWMIRWGITLVFAIVVLILVMSWFVKYPDIIEGNIVLTTKNPPTRIIARSTGRLVLNISNNAHVAENQLLGIIENPTDWQDVLKLESELIDIKIMNDIESQISLVANLVEEEFELGELQNPYSQLKSAIHEIRAFQETRTRTHQIKNLNNKLSNNLRMKEHLMGGIKLLEEDMFTRRENYLRDSILLEQKVIAPADLINSKIPVIQSKNSLQNARTNLIATEMQIDELRAQIEQIEIEKSEEERRLLENLKLQIEQLISLISSWEQAFLLRSPIEGTVSFSSFWSDDQFVNLNEEVMAVVPANEEVFGMISLPISGSGKMEVGQKVIIELTSYPAHEFGDIWGEVISISRLPRDEFYIVNIELPNGLLTTFDKKLEFKPEMKGRAEIITDDLKLIERVFNQLRGILD